MKKGNLHLCLAAAAIVCSIAIIACSKNNSSPGTSSSATSSKQSFSLYLTDAPGYFDSVFIDIKSVSVLVDTCDKGSFVGGYFTNKDSSCGVWTMLNISAGEYNLLSLRNGIDTLLASGTDLPAGKIKIIKIGLGTDNYLVKDSVSYPLHLFNKDSDFVLLNLRGNECDNYDANKSRLWLDFDVARSIINVNNTFYLRPVMRFFIVKTTAGISGYVLPHNARPVVSVINSTDTAYALPDRDGRFMVRGLTAGTYSVFINGSNGYNDTTLTNITVTAGRQTSVGAVTLHK